MKSVNDLPSQAPAAGVLAAPHEPLEILRMNIIRYRAMLALPADGKHRRQIRHVFLDHETALFGLEGEQKGPNR